MVADQIKKDGATFTPRALAEYLADELITTLGSTIETGIIKVLDPACGTGELLVAIGAKLDLRGVQYELYGYDVNLDYVNKVLDRLPRARLSQVDFLSDTPDMTFDLIIANPPYVRTQTLGSEKAQYLAEKYRLKGRVDLYYPFIIEMTKSLKTGGTIGIITSNRFMFTKGGESVRTFLSNHYFLSKVIDLGDTKLFQKAAVLPAIVIGKKRAIASNSEIQTPKFLKIYESENKQAHNNSKYDSIYEIIRHDKSGTYTYNHVAFDQTVGNIIIKPSTSNWSFLTPHEKIWTDQIERAPYRIKDFAKVRVGIKTTADNVFIRDDWETLPAEQCPEPELIRTLISQKDIGAWQAPFKSELRVLYTHTQSGKRKVAIDLEQFPKAKNYLLQHESQLKGRKYVIKANRNWFEIWVPQQPRLWPKPKLVFPDISQGPRFYYDESGATVNGNCYWISADDVDDPKLLLLFQGIANSTILATYHDLQFNNRLYAGRRRYFSQYVENYPIPDPHSTESAEIIDLVRIINDQSKNRVDISLNLKLLDQTVKKAFALIHS